MADAGEKYIGGARREDISQFLKDRAEELRKPVQRGAPIPDSTEVVEYEQPGEEIEMTACLPCDKAYDGSFTYNWWPRFKKKGYPAPAVKKKQGGRWVDPR